MDTTTNATKKWSARPRPAATNPPSYAFAPSNPAAIPCNPRRDPTPRCHQITKAEEISKTPTTRPAVRIVRNAPEFLIRFRRSLLRKAEDQEAETIAATVDQLMQICNLRCNGREATARVSNLCTLIRKTGTRDRHFVSFPIFLDSRFVVSSWK